jgi:hypothetical protein
MIKCIFKIILISYCFFISCKGNQENKININNDKTIPKELSKDKFENESIKEIYVGKTFFSGDELNNFTVVGNNNFKQIDCLSYSIYKSNKSENYIFSIEKFLKNEDVEKYEIIDLVSFDNYNFKNFIIKENILKNEINLEIFDKGKKLKSWIFKTQTIIPENWYGVYHTDLNENNKDWRENQSVSLTIKKDSIIYEVAGYQIFQEYKLKGKINKGNLKLKFDKAIENTESAVLEKTKDFGEISFDDKNYNWVCPYMDVSFMDGKKTIYVLNKK